MKIVRVDSRVDDITYGAVEPEGIRLHLGSPFVAWEPTETVVAWDQARLLAPVIPTKVVAVGRNYEEHAAELDKSRAQKARQSPLPVEAQQETCQGDSDLAGGNVIIYPPGIGEDRRQRLGEAVSVLGQLGDAGFAGGNSRELGGDKECREDDQQCNDECSDQRYLPRRGRRGSTGRGPALGVSASRIKHRVNLPSGGYYSTAAGGCQPRRSRAAPRAARVRRASQLSP